MNLTGKIEINAMLVSQSRLIPLSNHSIKQHQPLPVLAVRHKSEAINAAEQNVSGLRVVLQARLSWGDGLHRPNLDQCICYLSECAVDFQHVTHSNAVCAHADPAGLGMN